MNPLLQWALTAASGVLIAVITSVLTVRLSLRRFYSERWWEKKAQSYSEVLEALFHLKRYSDEYYDALIEHRNIAKDREDELLEKWKQASTDIERASAIGSFVMSEDSMNILEEYQSARRSGPHDDLYEMVEREVEAVKTCIPAFLGAAKRDLLIKG